MNKDDLVQATAEDNLSPNGQLHALCDFDGPWFGANYPDAFCVDGYLHDADHDGYDPADTDNPCPRCNTAKFLDVRRERAATTAYVSIRTSGFFDEMDGEEIWNRSKEWARQENADEAEAIIARLEAETAPPLRQGDRSELPSDGDQREP
jgi:hypothetical protein